MPPFSAGSSVLASAHAVVASFVLGFSGALVISAMATLPGGLPGRALIGMVGGAMLGMIGTRLGIGGVVVVAWHGVVGDSWLALSAGAWGGTALWSRMPHLIASHGGHQ